MAIEDAPTCQGCARPNRGRGNVCEPCRQRAAEWLAAIPGYAELLPTALISGGTGAGDGMKHRKPDAAPLGLNVNAFNLLATGAADFDLRETGSQVGVLPLHTWLNAWYDDWEPRYDFGTVRVEIPDGHGRKPGNIKLLRQLLTGGGKLVISRDSKGKATTRAISDTLDAEHAARFGRPSNWAINSTVAALASRLDEACDTHEDIGNFLVGLRAMVGACRSVVGERSDLMLVGRCPVLRDDDERCGGALWQDPYVSLIACPRCKAEWVEREWLQLGTRIRRAWPAQQQAHAWAGELVVVTEKTAAGETVEVDRYWLVKCGCGAMVPEQVRGKKLDAKGCWRMHVDAASAEMTETVGRLSA